MKTGFPFVSERERDRDVGGCESAGSDSCVEEDEERAVGRVVVCR